jgi:hypothetical protein
MQQLNCDVLDELTITSDNKPGLALAQLLVDTSTDPAIINA